MEEACYQRSLSTAGNYIYAHACLLNVSHNVKNAIKDWGFWHHVETSSFLIIHALCLCKTNVFALLLLNKLLDGINTSRPFCGVSVSLCHANAKQLHAFLPCNGMVRHAIIEYTIHIKKHGFGAKMPKAVFF